MLLASLLPDPPPSRLDSVYDLAKICHYEKAHAEQVTCLALTLFDSLINIFQMGAIERELLLYAGILHDIGWMEGWKNHHKTSLRVIMNTPLLPFSNHERVVVGSTARYHRGALPNENHDHYMSLEKVDRTKVQMLGGILRLADGLDASHQSLVTEMNIDITDKHILINSSVVRTADEEVNTSEKKSDLLSAATNRKVILKFVPSNQ